MGGSRGYTDRKKKIEEESYSHAEQPGSIMLQVETLVGKSLGTVNGYATGTVTVEEIATLDHKVGDLSKFASG